MRLTSQGALALTNVRMLCRTSSLVLMIALCPPLSVRAQPQPRGTPPQAAHAENPATTPDMTMETFLDRLMMAESGGRLTARNPRSTAVGPYQFIASTWLMIVNRHFKKETKDLRVDQVLALRMDPELSRRAADIYTQSNAAYLVAQGHVATFQNLRLAFLVGPGAAARLLSAPAETPLAQLLGTSVIAANPFMMKLTAAGLIARAARDISTDVAATAAIAPDPALIDDAKKARPAARPRIAISCNLTLPSCRRWLSLAQQRTGKKQRRASR